MRFLATVCQCGCDLATAEPGEALSRAGDNQLYAVCPGGCGRTYELTEGEVPGSPVAEEPAAPPEPEPAAEPTAPPEP